MHDAPNPLLLDLHAARGGGQLWPACDSLLAAEVSGLFNVGVFIFLEERPLMIQRSPHAPSQKAEWWRDNLDQHPLLHYIKNAGGIRVQRLTDVIPANQIKALPYYRDYVEPEGWLYSVALFFYRNARTIGLLGINRAERQGDFTDEEIVRLETLYPHFRTAILRVAEEEAEKASWKLIEKTITRSPVAVMILDFHGVPRLINGRAREWLHRWQFNTLVTPATSPPQKANIPRPIGEAYKELRDQILKERATQGRIAVPKPVTVSHPELPQLRAIVEPVASGQWSEPYFSVGFFVNEALAPGDSCREDLLSRLTPAEREVAEKAAKGIPNKTIAKELGKSPATVKTQLESAFRKLGVPGRSALGRLLAI